MMNEHGKSDSRIVPTKPPNKDVGQPPVVGPPSAEAVEGRRLAKGNPHQQTMLRTQRRVGMPHELERIRQAATLWRHDPRQEPSAVVPLAGICAGGAG